MNDALILGIETSCDETAAAIVEADGRIRADIVSSQIAEHQAHGGVVPEIAARAHIDRIDGVIREALAAAHLSPHQLTAIAATGGPGLIGGVLVGVVTAKAMAAACGIPFFAVNHLEGHALTARLTHGVRFPFLLLLVSGGHTQLLAVEAPMRYRIYGSTRDDAAGETFDKAAKTLGLPMPGGPTIETTARGGGADVFDLPRPLERNKGCDFSFSGLKTAVITAWQNSDKSARATRDLAAALQQAIADCLVSRSRNAMRRFHTEFASRFTPTNKPDFVVAGGVAANQTIRSMLEALADEHGYAFSAPPPRLCTDNAVMIAWAAIEHIRAGIPPTAADFAPRPRWPLTELAAHAQQRNAS